MLIQPKLCKQPTSAPLQLTDITRSSPLLSAESACLRLSVHLTRCGDAISVLHRCKEHGVTVGAAFSVASMLAMARAQARSYPLPQNMLMQTHINMRSQVRQLLCQHLVL